ncbi:glycosyltransferase family 2 protein [Aliiroseovarius lamellibrachiae]|uniref:glycosyltransferase family 2 protein n=1 Tax=Aliiroseovarius lamellibrachiae TaxID=1924933 RepID=UPI001BE01D9B|nr:glycosyltransferase family 2 protein [Aliiroseovarius lamellibrachiae]MBT2129784.1 glycosyltransferase [Aliiroseovarius lamellibrachiae]
MSAAHLRLVQSDTASSASHAADEQTRVPPPPRKQLGQVLMEMGALSPDHLTIATTLQKKRDVRLGDILLAHGFVRKADLYAALARQFNCAIADLRRQPPDARLIDDVGADFCIRNRVVPWKQVGAGTVIICSRPDEFTTLQHEFPAHWGRTFLAIAPEEDILDRLVAMRHRTLTQRAENRVAGHESCRGWNSKNVLRYALTLILGLSALFFYSTLAGFSLLVGWAVFTLVMNTGLKVIASYLYWKEGRKTSIDAPPPTQENETARLPMVSIMVPLYKEREIAGRLVKRLESIDYPRELLEICLVVEEDDILTQNTLGRVRLPRWMRQVIVPRGIVKTKPRALNFALDFCRGSIIGVYDAEDAPAADQILKITQRFAERGPDVACLQGKLDFYNARTNWLSRCFTVEYASWWRLILPGIEKMGFAIPLGGTTLFFRRHALEELGGWDAHNVTEDADLGMRLARHGYRTELVDTVTEEEANCRAWPWIKQRSRWIKGYAMTYGVHMRQPRQLLADLGWRKFIGFQILFLGSLSGVLLAPLLWTFWAFPLGLPHPLRGVMPDGLLILLGTTFVAAELLTITIGIQAVSGAKHRWLRVWVPTLHLYYPLASAAALKGFVEIVTKPFYWDKTQHGKYDTLAAGPITTLGLKEDDGGITPPRQTRYRV